MIMVEAPQEYIIEQIYKYGYQVKYNRFTETYQFGCCICREGKSLGKKRRCFYIPKNNNIFCHNCGWSSTPLTWIKRSSGFPDDVIFDEIKSFEPDNDINNLLLKQEEVKPTKTIDVIPGDSINLFDAQQVSFYNDNKVVKIALELLNTRKILDAVNKPTAVYLSLNDKVHKNRLIIPFYNEKKELEFYQSRTLLTADNKSKPKYLSKLYGDKTLFGMDKISQDVQSIFIFEGPINAMFVKNGVAVAGIQKGGQQFTQRQQEQIDQFKWHDKIWVLDSQWVDATSLEKTEKLLGQDQKVFIWPEKYGKKFKDFNDLVIQYKLNEISAEFIQDNTCEGITGVIRLAEIKKFWD